MTSLRPVLALGLAAGVAAGAVAIAAPKPAAKPAPAQVIAPAPAPVAQAAGGDVVVFDFPSIVNVRLVRAQNLLDDATSAQSKGDGAGAVAALTAVPLELGKAWLGAKYVIENAPPPVAEEGALGHSSGAEGSLSPYADQYATAAEVLLLQHTVAVTAMGMLDTASEPLLTAVSKTLFAALNARDASVAYIHTIPPPPVGEEGSLRARASGGAIIADWGSTMQGHVPHIDDELQMVDGIRAAVTLSPGRKRVLDAVELQDTKTARKINQWWPPVPADD